MISGFKMQVLFLKTALNFTAVFKKEQCFFFRLKHGDFLRMFF